MSIELNQQLGCLEGQIWCWDITLQLYFTLCTRALKLSHHGERFSLCTIGNVNCKYILYKQFYGFAACKSALQVLVNLYSHFLKRYRYHWKFIYFVIISTWMTAINKCPIGPLFSLYRIRKSVAENKCSFISTPHA